MAQITPPAGLRPETLAWWQSVVGKYSNLKDHHLKLLGLACRALDAAEQAHEAVEKGGAYFTDRHGVIRAHPGLHVEKENRTQFARLLVALGLDYGVKRTGPGRPGKGSQGA